MEPTTPPEAAPEPIEAHGKATQPKRKPGRPRVDPRLRAAKAVDGPAGGTEATSVTALTAPGEQALEGNPLPVMWGHKRTHRDRIADWIMMRSQGMKHSEIANKLGIQPATLSSMISRATQQGWLKFESAADRLEYEIAPKVVENINGFINDKDKQVTLEVAKGLGLLKTHQALKIEGDMQPAIIALNIQIMEPTTPQNSSGSVIGVPKVFIEGETIEKAP